MRPSRLILSKAITAARHRASAIGDLRPGKGTSPSVVRPFGGKLTIRLKSLAIERVVTGSIDPVFAYGPNRLECLAGSTAKSCLRLLLRSRSLRTVEGRLRLTTTSLPLPCPSKLGAQ